MNRYLSFAGDDKQLRLADFRGAFPTLPEAKAKVVECEADGTPWHLYGAVLDTETGHVFEWDCDGSRFGHIQWRNNGSLKAAS